LAGDDGEERETASLENAQEEAVDEKAGKTVTSWCESLRDPPPEDE
jgi:hypothetical protein